MSFTPKSLAELSQTVRGAFRQYMPGTDAALAQNTVYVISKVLALLNREYELRLKWIVDQLFLTSATDPAIIKLHAAEFGITLKPASKARGVLNGYGAAHSTYPADVRFASGENTFVSVQPFVADASGVFSVTVECEQPGLTGNRDAGAEFTIVDAILYPDIREIFVEGAGIGGGADAESVDALRTRALAYKAAPTQGGRLTDYENWAREVPGVTYAQAGLFANGFGHVGVWVLFAGRLNGIPTDSDLESVRLHIEAQRLVRVRTTPVAPVAKPVNLTLSLKPDTAAMRASVITALSAFFDARTNGSRIRVSLPDDEFTLPVAWISEVVSTVSGETRHTLHVPESDLAMQPGELPVLGTVTWI